ncbi:MAG: O-methyltransferase [Bacilli bacterium]
MVHLLTEIEEYANENNIPIMQPDGITFLTKYIKDNNIKTILEIGTAIGYSAIRMALIDTNINITTIERDIDRYHIAVDNINKFKLNNQINIINADALDVDITSKYDLIFIDAAKAQYIKFFNKFKYNLSNTGVIISDNLDFHGLTNNIESIKSRNLRQLVRKINNYREFLETNKEFKTTFYHIGDGIAVSKHKEEVIK